VQGARRLAASAFPVIGFVVPPHAILSRPAPEVESTREWHTFASHAACTALDVDPAIGLEGEEVARRRARVGENRLREPPRRSVLRMVVAQFADVMVLVLIAAAIVAGMLGEPQDTVAIVAIVVLNAALGFVQEYRAERAVRALQALAAPMAHVRRGGRAATIPNVELVPGDIVLLDAGAIVPADLRLLEVHHLRVDESALTGESHAADKDAAHVSAPQAPVGDRRGMAWKGTIVTYGRGTGVVVETGMRTELGRVASLLAEAVEPQTPLQKRLRRFAAQLAIAVLALCTLIFAIGLARGEPPLLMFLTALSLAVAAMPEALPAVVTISLALGARRMVRRHALVRRLPAVETLGSVTFICSDKTGTLTQNRMTVAAVQLADGDVSGGAGAGAAEGHPAGAVTAHGDGAARAALLRAMALNSDATHDATGVHGDPTEAALLRHALDVGVDVAGLARRHRRLAELPFSSERGRMTTLHAGEEGAPHVLVMKGAPERVLPMCSWRWGSAGNLPLDREAVLQRASVMAAAGLRVIAFATRLLARDGADVALGEADEAGCAYLGLVGLLDPPRPEAASAVAECHSAGIQVVMITGDHAATAQAIARQLAIAGPHTPLAITGEQLAQLDEETLQARCDEWRVYARVAPAQKIRLVRALQARGEFVAMTGDGVNDAPALRQADIGIAMGRGGTDVAREAAAMVLVDDNFASIVSAVREGRRIYDNIRRFIRYVLTGNSAEIWLLFLAPLVALPLPLLPIHILWINLVTDGLPGLALALEPAERGVMQRPPRPPQESVFAHGLWQHALWVGMVMGGACLVTQAVAYHSGSPHWQSMTFTVLALSQLGHVLAVRSERDSFIARGVWTNPALVLAVLGTAALQLATLYVPVLARVFRTQPLTLGELAACLAVSSITFLAVEGEKWAVRRGWSYESRGRGGRRAT
jgi:Ca2+-transporting ATPase